MRRRSRLRDKNRFRQVRKEGRSWADRLVVLCVLANNLSHSRFGFAVSRRVGGAVVRNRVKRQMREAVRLRLEDIQSGWDMVWIARPPIVHAKFADIEYSCLKLLERARLLNRGGRGSSND